MTDKEKIRKEVERLKKIHQMKYQQLDADNSMSLVECGKRNLCNELLSFIDSLQEEQKPAWSEEDEMRFNIIFKYLEGLPLSQNWLKSLGDRVKDNELTWEDIPEIFRISEQLKTSWWFMDNEQTKLIGTQVFWEEVLKRFKEKKGNNYDNCKDKER